jgi:heme oxygenase
MALTPAETSRGTLPTLRKVALAAPAQRSLNAPSILDAIRGAARSAHLRVEASLPMRRLISSDYTEREYVRHLCDLLGFYEPFEAALAAGNAGVKAPISPSRSRLLRRDLAKLGLTPAQVKALPRCGELPAVAGAGFFGCLYVYEGAALGGQVIARRLRQSLGPTQSFAFYHGNAERIARHWKAFCAYLDTREADSLAAVCASAVAVFDAFEQWFEMRSQSTATEGNP